MARQVFKRTEFLLLAPDGPNVPVWVELSYDSRDPLVVRAKFDRGTPDPVVWEFGRELLLDGLERPSGAGDVRVAPGRRSDDVTVNLSSPSGQAHFSVERQDLVQFLDEVYAAVPPGREWDGVDVDAELLALTREVA
ncbi:SsgA family sporulation/cell division regulator (plasmid) [Pseudonocardia sp. DSM 110487]|nr:SsgA family sporulation/cell division regulator [Pseudonocardia sp. DSM 110487]QYN41214.1 SsgA family sporulation/cell division regulator [Pseudonocardia sp. DSM 110487]